MLRGLAADLHMLKRSGMRVGARRQAYTHAGRRTCRSKTSAGTHEPRTADSI